MTDSEQRPLVWLPFDPSELAHDGAQPPAGLRYEVVDLARSVPDDLDEVEVLVPSYSVGPEAAQLMSRMPRLRFVQTLTAGVDSVRAGVPDGVTLCSGRGIHDASTAELAVTLALASLRGVPGFVRAQDRHTWKSGWHRSLADRRVLLVGYGAIGAALEARLAPFECDVVRVARSARHDPEVHAIRDLDRLLPEADVVILTVPLTDETRGLVDAGFLGRMKDGALLVNVARGAVVVTDDLVVALHSERITAAIDVADPEPLPGDSPLWDAPGLMVSPHVGGSSSAMWPRAYRLVREQLTRIAAGEEPVNIVTGDY